MSIFSSLKIYAQKWEKVNERPFTADEKDAVSSAVVVASEFGNSVCFTMKGGGVTFIPMSSDSTKGIGENIDLDHASIVQLSKPGSGEADIYRVKA